MGMRLAALAAVASVSVATAQQAGIVSPGKALMEQDPSLPYDPFTVLVRFVPGVSRPDRDLIRAILGADLLRSYHLVEDLELWLVPDAADMLDRLAFNPLIEYAEHDWVVRLPQLEPTPIRDAHHHGDAVPNDALFGIQWGMHNTGQVINGTTGIADSDIDAPEGWDVLTGGTGFVVAVIDSGAQWDHPDLAANIWSNPFEFVNGIDDDGNGYIDDVRGWDFFNNDNNPADPNGHGTHTAGTVGAVGNNGIGVAGTAWAVRIMPLRFLGANGTGSTSDAVAALEYAVDMGVKVSNNSWGSYAFSTTLNNAINASKSIGHVYVASAGNDGLNTDVNPHYPSGYAHDNIISVAATNNRDKMPTWSNYGASSVDLGAPGDDVASTFKNSTYVYLSGTSMAAPHVAGVAALLYIQNPSWTYQQVRGRILSTVRPTSAMNGVTATGGVLNLQDAIASSSQTPPAAPSNLAATDIGGGQAQLTWDDNSDNENRFIIIRQERVGTSWTNKTTVAKPPANTTSYVDTPGSGTFRYRVRATNQYGKSSWSAWSKVKVN